MPTDLLRLATWNCFGAPPTPDDFFAGRPFWPERLDAPAVAAALDPFDLVCVQENLVDRVRESLERVQRIAGFSTLWFDPMGPSSDGSTFVGGGLAFLSRLPIDVRFVQLPRGEGPDGFARKGFAIADVTLPSGRVLHVVNTHLQADDQWVEAAASVAMRASQITTIRRAIDALGPAASVVLCGDLNVPHGAEEYAAMRQMLGDRFVDAVGLAGLVTYDTGKNSIAAKFHSGGPQRMLIDYAFTPAQGCDVSDVRMFLVEAIDDVPNAPEGFAERAFASDHAGVGLTLTFTS